MDRTIRGTEVVRNVPGSDSHIFLFPDEGAAQIATLHDRLHAGALRGHLRADLRFVPHMTVGTTADSQLAERLAAEISVRSRMVRGAIANLALVDVGTSRVKSVTTWALGNVAGMSA